MKLPLSIALPLLIIPGMILGQAADVKPVDSVYIPGTSVGFEMTLVPGGTFLMGSPEDQPNRKPDEGPQFEVKLDSFWIGTHEVTFEEYNIFRDK